jgi:hypothetical protein
MKTKMMEKFKNLKKQKTELLYDRAGDGYVDVLIKILIAVGIGVAVFAVLNALIPGAINTLVQNAISQLTGSIAP